MGEKERERVLAGKSIALKYEERGRKRNASLTTRALDKEENRMKSRVIDIGLLPETLISQKRKNTFLAFSK